MGSLCGSRNLLWGHPGRYFRLVIVIDILKRRFIRGDTRSADLRPPWVLDPASFTDTCTRCNKCIELCPEQILVAGDGGFPRVDFTAAQCTFCGDCTASCEADLFDRSLDEAHVGWFHKAVVSDHCLTHFGVMCRSCEDSCEPRAIRFPLQLGAVPQPAINSQLCTGCGACVRPCPETAISMDIQRNLCD